MNQRYCREMELLLLSIRPEIDGDVRERIREITLEPVDWDSLLELASWHTLTPLLHWTSAALNWPCPPEFAAGLRDSFTANGLRNLFLTGELARLLRRFEESGIPVIAYKGPILATCYENPGLRQFEDLDLLIHKRDLARADRMLNATGFRPSEQRLEFADAFDFELTYESEDKTVCIDLHWSLMPRFFELRSDTGGIWERAVVSRLAGSSMRTLKSEDTLLVMCAHGTKHFWESLGGICDVARFVRAQPDMDWHAMFERAAEFRIVRALSLGLLLAIELLELRIPEAYRAKVIAEPSVRHLAQCVYRQLFEDRSAHWGAMAASRFLMSSRDNFADGLRCGADRILQPTKAEWRSIHLPRKLFPLYRPLRIVRLLTKHSGTTREH